MFTEKIKQLEIHAGVINDIMLTALTSFSVLEYLYTAKGVDMYIINHNEFLKHSRLMSLRIVVTELSKLYSGNRDKKGNPKKNVRDYFNLQSFIDRFRKGGEFELTLIDEPIIAKWDGYLELVKEKVDNLLKQRDKVYSHTDKGHQVIENEITLNEYKTLLGIVQRVLNEFYETVLHQPPTSILMFEPVHDLKLIVTKLSNERIDMLNAMEKHAIDVGFTPSEVEIEMSYFKENVHRY